MSFALLNGWNVTKISFDHAMSGNEGILSRGLRQGAKCLEERLLQGWSASILLGQRTAHLSQIPLWRLRRKRM